MSARAAVLGAITAILLLVLALARLGFTGFGSAAPKATAKPNPSPTTSETAAATPTPRATPAGYDHVVVIVLENHSFESVVGSSQAPYLNLLASRWSLATAYSGVSHPSLPNYLALIGGSTFGVNTDCTSCFISAPSLPDRLEAVGRTWKAYEEGMPSACFSGSSGLYAQKHDPFMYFDPIRNDPARCARVVPYVQLAADFASPAMAPDFAFITPNLCNDGHDCALSTCDAWLAREVPALMLSPAFAASRSLLVITYDEGEGGSERLVTILAGTAVKQGFQSAVPYNHYSLLRTVESLWGLAPLASGDGGAVPMSDFFAGYS